MWILMENLSSVLTCGLKDNKIRICSRTQFMAHITPTFLSLAYFRNAGNHHLEVVEETLLALQSDLDQDVSFFASLEPKMQTAIDTTILEK